MLYHIKHTDILYVSLQNIKALDLKSHILGTFEAELDPGPGLPLFVQSACERIYPAIAVPPRGRKDTEQTL